MYFTNGSSRAFEMLMRGKPGFDRYENGGCADCEDCNTCHFYRPHWKYQSAKQGADLESQGAVVANAVPAGGLGLHPRRAVPYQP